MKASNTNDYTYFLFDKITMNDPQAQRPHPSKKRSKIDRKALKRVINDLVKRRQEHQERINKLIDPNYQQQDITKASGYNEFSEMFRILQADSPPQNQQLMGNIGNHVNLLATVSLKTEYTLMERVHIREAGELYASLLQRFGSVHIAYGFDEQEPKNIPQWLRELVKYLNAEDLANGLFEVERTEGRAYDFYARHFERGKYEEAHLSKEPLQEEEVPLVVVGCQKGKQFINICWLLLVRLLKGKHTNFPLALHRLFSYPCKQYAIRESIELIRMNEILAALPELQPKGEKTVHMYGIEQKGKTSQICTLSKSKNIKSYENLVHHFQSILIVNQVEFPVRHLPLSCLRNHFVVVTLTVPTEDYYYINVGSEVSWQRFKLCVLDFEGNIVQYETILNGQFMLCLLKAEEYELYISPEGSCQEPNDPQESFQLVREAQEHFSLWIQGNSVESKQGTLLLEIKLKQQYSNYTQKIASNYMLDQDSKQPEDIQTTECVTVKRSILKCLNLVVDQFLPHLKGKLTVRYKQANLCDQHFQDHSATFSPKQPLILREETEIESLTIGEEANVPFRILRFFL